jgi:hypothetical protein
MIRVLARDEPRVFYLNMSSTADQLKSLSNSANSSLRLFSLADQR